MHQHNYAVSTFGFEIKLRGHVAEQDVFDELNRWAGDSLQIPDLSNNPGSDLTLGDHEFNVKVGSTSDAIRTHLAQHPDIPVIVNADMANLPPDALHVDLSKPIDPDLLADHSVIVADGLTLGGLHDQLADAIGPALDSFDAADMLGGMSDLGVPVLGSAIRVVRSGIREQRLAREHGDRRRAIRNVAGEVALVGGGVTIGGAAGTAVGTVIDVLSMGATGGLAGSVVGPAVGSFVGSKLGNKSAKARRLRPYVAAREHARACTVKYDGDVAQADRLAREMWNSETAISTARLDSLSESLERQLTGYTTYGSAALSRAGIALTQDARSTLDGLIAQDARPIGVRATRRARSWRDWAGRASTAGELIDALAVHVDGRPPAERLLEHFVDRRATVLAAVAFGVHGVRTSARQERLAEVGRLQALRDDLGRQVRREVFPALHALWLANQSVRAELVATGKQSKAWVSEHLPTTPEPTLPS